MYPVKAVTMLDSLHRYKNKVGVIVWVEIEI